MKELSETLDFDIRFSEVDSMHIAWHGSYVLYFEDAREAFGRKYDLGYLLMFGKGSLKCHDSYSHRFHHLPLSAMRS